MLANLQETVLKSGSLHNDKELFQQLAGGDANAYAQIFHLYFDTLYRNAWKILKSSFWAEEIVQDVFLQLWLNRNKLPEVDTPAAYLYKITVNRCFDRIRRQELESKMQYLVNRILHGSGNTYQHNSYDLNLIKQHIQEAVDRLPPQQKQVFQLQKEQGSSYEEIAEELKISRNTVRNHMVKALQSIRLHLAAKGDWLLLCIFLILFLK